MKKKTELHQRSSTLSPLFTCPRGPETAKASQKVGMNLETLPEFAYFVVLCVSRGI
jgi:hypothetical protein